jgi:hypothetical protein
MSIEFIYTSPDTSYSSRYVCVTNYFPCLQDLHGASIHFTAVKLVFTSLVHEIGFVMSETFIQRFPGSGVMRQAAILFPRTDEKVLYCYCYAGCSQVIL